MTALYHIAIFWILASLIATLSFLIRWRRRKAKDQRTVIDVPLRRGKHAVYPDLTPRNHGPVQTPQWWRGKGDM